MIKYFETEKGYKRVKASVYLRKAVYDRIEEISKRNELSFSETSQRLLEKSMGGVL
jgi:macrodomain Ter protein organizer (MatP/YcbG family)